jgi:DNA invertase Pin-like site-specific DNA recombinase
VIKLENGINQNQKPQSYKAALYLRFGSSHQANDEVIKTQSDALHIFSKQQGYAVCAEYRDDGYGGNTLDRPAFMEMQAAIEAGTVDTVVVRNLDRIARNFFLRESWLDKMRAQGVKIIAADGSHELPPLASILAGLVRGKTGMLKTV